MDEIRLKESWIQTRAAMSESLLAGALHAVFQEKMPADQYLKRVFRQDRRIGGRDRRLYADLIFAVFRWFGILRRHSSTPAFYLAGAAAAEKITDPVVGIFLKDAGLTGIQPAELFHAELPFERLKAFLHRAGAAGSAEEYECVPEWILPHLDFTPDKSFFTMQQTRSPLWLRIQRTPPENAAESLRRQGIGAVPHDRIATALRIPDAGVNLPELEACKQGWIEVQDLSSQAIGLACSPEPEQIWWDACAGGGGKTLQLASQMNGKGVIISSDVRENKLAEIRRRAAHANFSNIRTKKWDGIHLPMPEKFCDGVLVDAPCSSSGRWRRNPESRWLLAEKHVSELSAVQKQILSAASKAVKSGGILVYATCSFLSEENRGTAECFLAAHPEFELEPFPHPMSGETVPGMVQILPEDGDCDASFIARFRRRKEMP